MKKIRWADRKKVFSRIMELRAEKLDAVQVAERLNEEGVKTAKGAAWDGTKVGAFVYVCRQAGMKKPRGKAVTEAATETPKVVAPKIRRASLDEKTDERVDLVERLIASGIPTRNKAKAIVAIVEGWE